jgi:hypothetical protein
VTAILERAASIAWRGIASLVAAELPAERRRASALYLLVIACNVPGATAARIAGCSKQNISKMIARVEQLREDPDYDRQLARIEERLAG